MTQASPRIAPKPPRSDRYALAALCAGLVISVATPSRADDAENTAAARTLGIQGVQLADAGKCPEAIEKLQRAESLHHAPTILDRLGECQVAVGQLVTGTENLNSVVREPLAANAPQVYRDAQDRARKVLATATPKIAHLTISVVPADANPTVTIGGKPIPSALIGAERPTDPGTLEVTATAPGYRAAGQSVTLAEGGHQEITLTLEKDPNAVAPLPPVTTPLVPPPASAATPPEPAPKKSHTLAYVALGVGGAGLLVGTVTGVLALGKASDCPNKVCSSQSKLDDAKGMATVSTVGFGIGVVGVALGTILLVTGHSEESAPAQSTAHYEPKLSLKPWFGVNTAGLMGSFQ
ncbi:MAG TPA: hypothetical protein VNW92_00405 [Polyangiaceae bacterium]|jgi:hypothetical protein|nr:hypothetical protein [Polyangiaceae bacterium]